MTRSWSWSGRVRRAAILLLAGVPVLTALAGPALARPADGRGIAFDPARGLFGTDFAGRDVLAEVLAGGIPIIGVTIASTLFCYLIAVPLGLAAALGRRRHLDELIMRPLDLVLAIPSLLLLIMLASIGPRGWWFLVGIVVVILAPDATRVIRAAALTPASSPAAEAMLLQRESRFRIAFGYVGRSVIGTVIADSGVRFIGALYLVASASFLGVGVDPDASNWGVMVDQNRDGLLLQPAATLVPAGLIVALAVGLNLAVDEFVPARPGTKERATDG
ncbi:ABC transporter permease [Microlunatus sp. GCM10028923]|uniref:ABC transporter permease n=1 Tax=Microlunatus sp. GCM10028923 TaxID=3273400 RepID=UPI0036148B75